MYENISIDSHLPMHDMGAGLRAVAYDETPTNIGPGNDTLIGEHLCKVWCQQERQLLYLGHPTFTDKYYQLYVFEENKKVWFLFDGETTPHLFFDKSK